MLIFLFFLAGHATNISISGSFDNSSYPAMSSELTKTPVDAGVQTTADITSVPERSHPGEPMSQRLLIVVVVVTSVTCLLVLVISTWLLFRCIRTRNKQQVT